MSAFLDPKKQFVQDMKKFLIWHYLLTNTSERQRELTKLEI